MFSWHSPIDSSYKCLHSSQRKMYSQYVDVPPVLCLPDSYWCQTRNQNPAQKEKTKGIHNRFSCKKRNFKSLYTLHNMCLCQSSCGRMQESGTSEELKTSGSRKLSSAQSSWRLFCSGVPVSSNRFVVLNSLTISESWENKLYEQTLWCRCCRWKTDNCKPLISHSWYGEPHQWPGISSWTFWRRPSR